MKIFKKIFNFILPTLITMPVYVFAATGGNSSALPPGKAITLNEFGNLIIRVGNFVTWGAGILIVVSIIWAGIKMSASGPDTNKTKDAWQSLKSSIYGAAIILGVGVIIQTVAGLVTRDFFCRIMVLGVCLIN